MERSLDWIRQAERDLETGRWLIKGGFSEWACFLFQQAAEKAVRAVYKRLGDEAWGHSVLNLLQGLREKVDVQEEVVEAGRILDRFYIPSRYPNGWHQGIPADYITREEAENALACAQKVIRFCKSILAGQR